MPKSRAGALVAAYLADHRNAMLAAEPGVRAFDADAIHDMRVAARRLRSTLRTFRPLLDRSRTEPLAAELRWFGRLLGAARDGDVLAARVAAAVDDEPPELVIGPVTSRIRQRLAADAARARDELTAGLDGARFAALVAELNRLVAGRYGPDPGAKHRRVRRRVRRTLRRADRRMAAAHDGAAPPPAGMPAPGADRDTRLHEARKAYKRARYAAEAVAPLAGKPARRLVKRLKALQDTLGDHQDALVAGELLRDQGVRAHGDGENAFTYGLLLAREQARGERALAGLDRARRRVGKAQSWLDG